MARRGSRPSLLDGFLVIDKRPNMTSHDVVGILRRQLGERRVGHAGTLDPDATGVLVVAVGRSTRLMRFVTGCDKAYSAEVVLGVTTSTLDASGVALSRFDMSSVTIDEVRAAANSLTGAIQQIPPMVSAIKIDGRRLYELARAGEEVERQPRAVVVSRFDVRAASDPSVYAIEVECSSGTYVRSLAADLGELLGGGAHLRALRRTRVGPFTLEGALDANVATAEDLRRPAELVASMTRVAVGDIERERVLHGGFLSMSVIDPADAASPGPFAVLDVEGALIAVYERTGPELLRPIVVHVAVETSNNRDEH